MADTFFSYDELNFISDKTFFEKKAAINSKVMEQLNELQAKVNALLQENKASIPEIVLQSSPKISRGENYKGYPWLVLDYPRVFRKEEVFAFRTLFWWGHSWVLAFQLSGSLWHRLHSSILSHLNIFSDSETKIGLGDDPWVHNPDDEMYLAVKEWMKEENAFLEKIKAQSFFKLVRKVEFSRSENLPEESIAFYRSCLRLLKA